jgi:hypothetical protein
MRASLWFAEEELSGSEPFDEMHESMATRTLRWRLFRDQRCFGRPRLVEQSAAEQAICGLVCGWRGSLGRHRNITSILAFGPGKWFG